MVQTEFAKISQVSGKAFSIAICSSVRDAMDPDGISKGGSTLVASLRGWSNDEILGVDVGVGCWIRGAKCIM